MSTRATILSVLALLSMAAGTIVARLTPADAAPNGRRAVVVELFTSEGCSSCPPADDVLAMLERTQPVAGAEVVPIAFHVDYWDGIGWPDPFAGPWATARQRSYAPLGGGTYTPQAVIDGASQVVGSRARDVESAVSDAARKPHASVAIDVERKGGAFAVIVRPGALPEGAREAEIVLVLAQRAARVTVHRGENAGRTLDHTAIARMIRVLGPASAVATTEVKPSSEDMRVIALVQERGSRRILGAATRDLPR